MFNHLSGSFLLICALIKFVYGFENFENDSGDTKIMMKLIERVANLEKNEKQLMDSNVQLRMKVEELNGRLKSLESVCDENVIKRIENIEMKSLEKDNFVETLKAVLKLRKSNSSGSICVKSEIPVCDDHELTGTKEGVGIRKRGKRLVMSEPVRPAFTAYLDHPIKTLGQDQAIVYNRVLLNDGNAYNNSSGIFTASVPGVYLFSWAATARKLSGETAYDIWVKLVVNGKHILGAVAESRDDWDDNQGSNTAIIRVKQGDQVWTVHYSNRPNIHGDDNERTTSFSGVLLYDV